MGWSLVSLLDIIGWSLVSLLILFYFLFCSSPDWACPGELGFAIRIYLQGDIAWCSTLAEVDRHWRSLACRWWHFGHRLRLFRLMTITSGLYCSSVWVDWSLFWTLFSCVFLVLQVHLQLHCWGAVLCPGLLLSLGLSSTLCLLTWDLFLFSGTTTTDCSLVFLGMMCPCSGLFSLDILDIFTYPAALVSTPFAVAWQLLLLILVGIMECCQPCSTDYMYFYGVFFRLDAAHPVIILSETIQGPDECFCGFELLPLTLVGVYNQTLSPFSNVVQVVVLSKKYFIFFPDSLMLFRTSSWIFHNLSLSCSG